MPREGVVDLESGKNIRKNDILLQRNLLLDAQLLLDVRLFITSANLCAKNRRSQLSHSCTVTPPRTTTTTIIKRVARKIPLITMDHSKERDQIRIRGRHNPLKLKKVLG